MKKTLKCIIFNIIYITLILLCAETFLFYQSYCWEIENKKHIQKLEKGENVDISIQEKINLFKYTFTAKYRNKGNLNYDAYRHIKFFNQNTNNKPSIILMGCSFTYGYGLDDNKTFNAILKKITNRCIYNLGIIGSSPREMLITLRTKEFIKDIQNPEYVIYTYIPDHRKRLYAPLIDLNTNFYKKGNSLVGYKQPQIIYSSFLIKKIMELSSRKKFLSADSAILFKLYISEINKEIKSLYGSKTKFVILVYEDDGIIDWKEIEKLNILENKIIILDVSEITETNINTEEYRLTNDHHPNEKAWELIVSALVKELDL